MSYSFPQLTECVRGRAWGGVGSETTGTKQKENGGSDFMYASVLHVLVEVELFCFPEQTETTSRR